MQADVLIGRDRPAGILGAEISRTVDSHGGLVLITGEAGIGKSALVAAAMEEPDDGTSSLSARRAGIGKQRGYWPWVQVVHSLQRTAAADEWDDAFAAAGDGLTYLLGRVAKAIRLADPRGRLPAVRRRHHPVGHRVTQPTGGPSCSRTSCADPASIKLLDFVVRHSWFERLLVVGTYRDDEVGATGHPMCPLVLPLLAAPRASC